MSYVEGALVTWSDFSVELGSLTTANLMEKVRGLQNLAYQLGLEECEYTRNTLHNQLTMQQHVWKMQLFIQSWKYSPLLKHPTYLMSPLDGGHGFPDTLGVQRVLMCFLLSKYFFIYIYTYICGYMAVLQL